MTDGVGELPQSPLSDAPGVRGFWTGTELVVIANSEGAAFDAVKGSWRRIAAPPRLIRGLLFQGSPTWTGSEIAVLYPGVGAAYDPKVDRWRAIDGAGFVPQRVIATPTHLVALTDDTPGRVMQGSMVNLQSGKRQSMPAPPFVFTYPSWPLVMKGELVVVGRSGRTGSLAGAAKVAALDTRRRAWRILPDAPISGQAVAASWDGRELIAVEYANNAAAYDPTTRRWRRLPNRPLRFGEHYPVAYRVASGTTMTWGYTGDAVLRDGEWLPIPKRNALPIVGASTLEVDVVHDDDRSRGTRLAVRDVEHAVDRPTQLSVGIATLTLPADYSFVSASNPGEPSGPDAVISLASAAGSCELRAFHTTSLPDGPRTRLTPVDGSEPFDALETATGTLEVLVGTSDYVAIECVDRAAAQYIAAHLSFPRH